MLRESRESSSAVDGKQSSSRMEGGGEEHLQTRRSKRLAGRKKIEKPSLESVVSEGDDDFTMAPPPNPPAWRGHKRKRDNLQEE